MLTAEERNAWCNKLRRQLQPDYLAGVPRLLMGAVCCCVVVGILLYGHTPIDTDEQRRQLVAAGEKYGVTIQTDDNTINALTVNMRDVLNGVLLLACALGGIACVDSGLKACFPRKLGDTTAQAVLLLDLLEQKETSP